MSRRKIKKKEIVRHRGMDHMTQETLDSLPDEIRDAPPLPRMVMPEEDVLALRTAITQPHGTCIHFRLEEGQRRAKEEQFFERLMLEEKYDPKWLNNPKQYGLCDIFPDRLVSALGPGYCKRKEARMHPDFHDLEVTWRNADQKIVCPFWEDRKKAGSFDGKKLSVTVPRGK